jgi:maltooligosyltrehalose trehalohydrolase
MYFTSHGDPDLIEAVRRGRRDEFASFAWQGEVPDPQDEATFQQSRLRREEVSPEQLALRAFYQRLIALRRELPPVESLEAEADGYSVQTHVPSNILTAMRSSLGGDTLVAFNFAEERAEIKVRIPGGAWRKLLDSDDPTWNGNGEGPPDDIVGESALRLCLAPLSFVVFERVPARLQ